MEVGVLAGIAAGAVLALLAVLALGRRSSGDAAIHRQLGELAARLAALEGSGTDLRREVGRVQERLAQTDTAVQQLQRSTESVRTQMEQASQQLARLGEAAQALRETDSKNAEVLRRLELLMAGTATKGAAGESVVEALFRQLPPEWQQRDVQIEGKVVEFALRLPSGLIVPIDSKWPATSLLEELARAQDGDEAARVRQRIVHQVRQKMQEVQKYVHPELTAGFAIAVVPDAVAELATEAQVEGLRMNVVLLGYGSLIPYLLLVVQTAIRSGTSIDVQRLASALDSLRQLFAEMEEELEGRFSRALTMLQNSRDTLRAGAQRAAAALATIEARAEQAALPPPEESSG
jgi:DNA recombination protein RmuC